MSLLMQDDHLPFPCLAGLPYQIPQQTSCELLDFPVLSYQYTEDFQGPQVLLIQFICWP